MVITFIVFLVLYSLEKEARSHLFWVFYCS